MAAPVDGFSGVNHWRNRLAHPTPILGYGGCVAAVFISLLFRYAFREMLGTTVPYLQFYPAVLFAAWYGGLGPGLLATGLSATSAAYYFLPADGLRVDNPADQLSLAVFMATGLVITWLNHHLHVSKQDQLAATAIASARAERLDAILATTVDGIIVIDSHGRVEAFNPAAERLFGYRAQEVVGRNVHMLMPPPYHEEHDRYLARYLATERAQIIGKGREVEGRRKDGTTFPLHLSVGEFIINGERKFTGILHDLSSRVRMEDQLREQAALARLGEMAAVIAHEVKNPLAGIRGAIQIFSTSTAENSPHRAVLKEIVERIDSLDRMMRDLLVFGRPPHPRRAPTDVAPLVSSTAKLLHQDPALHDVDVQVHGTTPTISADPEMLRIVFQNLLINSGHAMQGKGRIRVDVSTYDQTCQIAFADDGPGIPLDIRQKIFNPFFTTKNRGSGLGLPTAKRLIEAHNGQIAIDCPPAGGTSVVIRLPL